MVVFLPSSSVNENLDCLDFSFEEELDTTNYAKPASSNSGKSFVDMLSSTQDEDSQLFYQELHQKYNNTSFSNQNASIDNKQKFSEESLILNKEQNSDDDNDELSPLEDFYSLKNAASDDEDAKYYFSLFKPSVSTSSSFTSSSSYNLNSTVSKKKSFKNYESSTSSKKWYSGKKFRHC